LPSGCSAYSQISANAFATPISSLISSIILGNQMSFIYYMNVELANNAGQLFKAGNVTKKKNN